MNQWQYNKDGGMDDVFSNTTNSPLAIREHSRVHVIYIVVLIIIKNGGHHSSSVKQSSEFTQQFVSNSLCLLRLCIILLYVIYMID